MIDFEFGRMWLPIGTLVVCNATECGTTFGLKRYWQGRLYFGGASRFVFLVIDVEHTMAIYDRVRHYVTDKGILTLSTHETCVVFK